MNIDIQTLRRQIDKGHVQWQQHALERMFQRGIKRENDFRTRRKKNV